LDAELSEQRIQRDMQRRHRECERQWEASSSSGKKSRITRDRDQDVSERIALGMASTRGSTGTGEVAYDERLFNQDTGMDSRFAVVDQYNVYSGRLFAM
jgi:SNW domain-containing protein 1